MDRQQIADFYLTQPEADAAPWLELAGECLDLRCNLNLDIRPVAESEPYPTALAMFADIERGRFLVSTLNCEHPLWLPAENVDFRVVHDVLGHKPVRAPFTFAGELAAYLEQRKHHSELAQRALYTEIIAQTCVYNVYRIHSQRAVLFPDEIINAVEELRDV